MLNRSLVIVLAALALTGCVTASPTQFSTPKSLVTECRQLCTDVGLEMSAMVVIMNSSGCVCEVPKADSNSTPKTSSAAVGGAVIAASIARQRQEQPH